MSKDKSDFFERVWAVVVQIPCGRVSSYGAIAEYLGSKSSSRVVGYAMNASHTTTTDIPAHRVVNRNGVLSGKHHFGAPGIMQQLLESEGIEVIDDTIIDFKKHFWNPCVEL